jgi:hypothetical protein
VISEPTEYETLAPAGCDRIFTNEPAERWRIRWSWRAYSTMLATGKSWSCGGSIGSGARCATSWTPSWISSGAATASGRCRESLNTTVSGGKLVFRIFAALAGVERDLIRERTRAALEAARRAGATAGARR